MKNIIGTVIAITFCFVQSSCNKDFLYKTDPTRISSNDFYKDKTQIEQAVNGVFGQLQGIINSQWLFNELPSDKTTIDFNPGDRGQAPSIEAFEYWQVNSGTSNLVGMYNSYYSAIYNINNTLSKIPTAVATDSIKNLATGQLKFLRGYFYFELTQYFGDVVLITEPIVETSKAWDYLRDPKEKVYTQIENDLKEAANLLQPKYTAANLGRPTKGSALALLGKFYLTKKQYPEAVNTLKSVLSLGNDLLPSYADVFDPKKKNSVESVFEVQYQGGNDLGEWSSFIYTFAPRISKGAVTGWPQSNPGGWNIPTNDMIAQYEAGDARKDASVGLDFKSPITGDVVPYIKKYNHPHTIYGRTDDNWPVLRYSDVLLMLAEAINEQGGPTSEAFDYMNRVRVRAKLNPLTGLDQQSFRTAVLKERRVELAFENWRWFDLKRTKSATELTTYLNAYGATERAHPTVGRQGIPNSNTDYIFEPHEALYPIPSTEILVNNKLSQNQGY
jgi:hypothetical protein